MPFWRREPLHERLAREGGLAPREPPPHDTRPRWGEVAIHGVARPREWDAVETADAPGLDVHGVEFVAFADGTLLVDDEVAADALGPLADALERTLAPPYRAQAVRRGEELFAVGGRRIRVAELPETVEGNQLELTSHEGFVELSVDGRSGFGTIPPLERLAGGLTSYVVRAQRLDGNIWEIEVSAL